MVNEAVRGKLVLEDGSVFHGVSFGFTKSNAGEVVFNTGMVGYPETLTDPSYKGQILALTYPLVGNYGIPPDDAEHGLKKFFESDAIHVQGLIISDYCESPSHWNSKKTLAAWLREHSIPALYGIDTRELTKKLRENGTMLGRIELGGKIKGEDPNKRNLVAEVSCKKKQLYGKGKKRIVLVDCGAKNNILRSLLRRNVEVLRVPWDYDFNREHFDGIVISNGPGDPKQAKATIENVQSAMEKEKPIFGICLGNQILSLAAGADTYKLKYGHRSQNQPCILADSKRCFITSQNHGYAVNTKTLSKEWKEWFVNANDATNEGVIHKSKPFMSVQFHPEATPGPTDTEFLFDEFLKVIDNG
ncbi:glutamine-hydrolyzing carbamoyl-phosphate synthase small subunit [Candidatus Woesearchaeota archaeon]|nr:glutamine-hydrolyzing carbamoyl-phosphate synthase small subunit [Candidatus Woesearchaeota archaeon]